MKNQNFSFFKTPIFANKHEFPTPNLRMNIVPMFYELNKKNSFLLFFWFNFSLFLHTMRKEKPSRDLTKIKTN